MRRLDSWLRRLERRAGADPEPRCGVLRLPLDVLADPEAKAAAIEASGLDVVLLAPEAMSMAEWEANAPRWIAESAANARRAWEAREAREARQREAVRALHAIPFARGELGGEGEPDEDI
jgi:hypothetical protein